MNTLPLPTAPGTTPTVLLVVDRNELEGQLSGWVHRILGELANSGIAVEQATSGERLRDLLASDFRGLILTMIHKFTGAPARLNTRDDIYVLIDEAHRSVGGPSLGNYLMGALPNASFIGFTGTPIAKTEQGRGTFKIFGIDDVPTGYLDKYSIAESIADKTTLKLRHHLAPSHMLLNDELLEQEFFTLAESEGVADIEDLNRVLERAVHLRTFLKADERVELVAAFVAKHFQENVYPLGYKAFLVAVDREACALYKKALDRHLPPEWSQAIYTKSSNDVVERPLVAELQLDEFAEKTVRKEFPKPDTQPRILIVTDKLLTGYDAPILYCMYLDKPMRDHVLLQAVARVNRPYSDAKGVQKPCGLIIDFIGILKNLRKALAFDSEDYSGVIEDLDVLFLRFRELMDGPAKKYFTLPGEQGRDQQLEHLLFKVLFTKVERESFIDLFKEIETLYEILSPDPALRGDISNYNFLADLYAMMRSAYGTRTSFLGDLAHKTARLVQENASIHGLDRLTQAVEFDAAALDALRKRQGPDEGKVIDLIRGLRNEENTRKPYLLSILERADAVMEKLEEHQTKTAEARRELEALMAERLEAEKARQSSGLPEPIFVLYWALHRKERTDARELALELDATFQRYPHAKDNDDEGRQLKAEIYKTLLKFTKGKAMIDLAEELLRLRLP